MSRDRRHPGALVFTKRDFFLLSLFSGVELMAYVERSGSPVTVGVDFMELCETTYAAEASGAKMRLSGDVP